MVQQSNEVEIFCCYARKDEKFLDELNAHLSSLQRQKVIGVWHDGDISAGTEWELEIKEHLSNAKIILLLISSDFIRSDYCYGTEMQQALERHKRREARVIPVILRPVDDWKKVPPGDIQLGQLQALPKDAKPVTSWNNRDTAWLDVACGIRKAIEELSTVADRKRQQVATAPLIIDIGTIHQPSRAIGNAEVRFSLTNVTGKIVKVTSIALTIVNYVICTDFLTPIVAGPVDEYFLRTAVKPALEEHELLTKHHELRQDTEGFFLKIDAVEGYTYILRLDVLWNVLGEEKNRITSPSFEIKFPVRSAEGLLKLAQM